MIPFEIFILPFLLCLSFLFSGFETAFISLNPWDIEKLSEDRFQKLFIYEPSKVLSTILFANNFVNVGIAVILTSFLYRGVLKGYAVEIGGLLSFILILLFGEIFPKVTSKTHPELFFSKTYKVVSLLSRLFFPVTRLFEKISSLFIPGPFKAERKVHKELKDEVFLLSMIKEREGEIPVELGRALRSLLKISDKNVKEVMKSRTELFALSMDMEFKKFIKKFLDSSLTRVPVYRESLDRILGILHVKDLQRIRKKEDISKYMRKPIIIPENTNIIDLVNKIKEENMPFVIVVGEFGGTSGFLTLYDIMLEFLGEIEMEETRAENYIIVDARIRIDDLIERYFMEFPQGDFETLNGFILNLSGKIPEKGEIIEYGNYRFEILERSPKMIRKVKIHLPSHTD